MKNQESFRFQPDKSIQLGQLDSIRAEMYSILNSDFFRQFRHFNQYEVSPPKPKLLIGLTEGQVKEVKEKVEKIQNEFNSVNNYRFGQIRNLIMDLGCFALKLQYVEVGSRGGASLRIASGFLKLLEGQFPIDKIHSSIQLRTPAAFADQLNIHVNHLNRALKETTQKSTSTLISERILQEAKILLKHSSWNVSEIAYSLGYTEVPHFNNFFKKHTAINPTQFRKSQIMN